MNASRGFMFLVVAGLLAFYAHVLYLASRPQVSELYRLYYIDKNLRQWNHGQGPIYALGQVLDFRRELPFLSRQGWSVPEDWGTWTDGHWSEIYLRVSGTVMPQRLVIDLNPYIVHAKGVVSQTVKVYANGQLLGTRTVREAQTLTFTIPATAWHASQGFLRLRFEHGNPAVPRDLGLSPDRRVLALGFLRLRLD